MVPPESIPNSEVKHFNANGSARSPCVRVGHCQVLLFFLILFLSYFLKFLYSYLYLFLLNLY